MNKFVVAVSYYSDVAVDFANLVNQSFKGSKIFFCATSYDAFQQLKAKNISALLLANHNADIGAWQEWVKLNYANLSNCTGVVFLNDTIVRHHNYPSWYLKKFSYATYNTPCIGILDFADVDNRTDFRIEKFSTPGYWLSTHLFYLDENTLKLLDYTLDMSLYFSTVIPQSLNLHDNPKLYGKGIADHLDQWLFGGGWYASEPLTTENYDKMRKKIIGILCEKFITMRLFNKQIIPKNFNASLNVVDRLRLKLSRLVGSPIK